MRMMPFIAFVWSSDWLIVLFAFVVIVLIVISLVWVLQHSLKKIISF